MNAQRACNLPRAWALGATKCMVVVGRMYCDMRIKENHGEGEGSGGSHRAQLRLGSV